MAHAGQLLKEARVARGLGRVGLGREEVGLRELLRPRHEEGLKHSEQTECPALQVKTEDLSSKQAMQVKVGVVGGAAGFVTGVGAGGGSLRCRFAAARVVMRAAELKDELYQRSARLALICSDDNVCPFSVSERALLSTSRFRETTKQNLTRRMRRLCATAINRLKRRHGHPHSLKRPPRPHSAAPTCSTPQTCRAHSSAPSPSAWPSRQRGPSAGGLAPLGCHHLHCHLRHQPCC